MTLSVRRGSHTAWPVPREDQWAIPWISRHRWRHRAIRKRGVGRLQKVDGLNSVHAVQRRHRKRHALLVFALVPMVPWREQESPAELPD